jgi:hypothetical protein
MTATNHVLTGSVFVAATAAHVPLWISLPAAFLLHFVLDALPHFGQRGEENEARSLKRHKWTLPLDAGLAATVLITIFVARPEHYLAIIAGGVLCAAPDLWSFTRFVRFLKRGDASYNKDWFAQFHHRIQWGERLWGAWIELAWALTFGWLLWQYL